MPVRGRRGTFTAVTFTVVVLSAVGLFAKCARGLIPPPEPNDLAGLDAPFMKRADTQSVHWRTTEMEPFAEARRLDRPVMVFAGTASSQAARRFDDAIFTDHEVSARLNRDFVCVRVDFTVEPEWRCAFLSVKRSAVGADPSFVVLFFKPNGEMLTWIGRRGWGDRPDFNDFLGRLDEIITDWRAMAPGTWSQSEYEQHDERLQIRGGAVREVLDVRSFIGALREPRTFFQWQAGRYRVLLQNGLAADADRLLREELSTPRIDLVDGGFFRIGSGDDPGLVEFDKVATTSADMAAVLAATFAATGDPLVKYVYERTMQGIAEQFVSEERWSSSVQHAVGEDERCPRNCFGTAIERTRFSPFLKEMAADLGLDPGKNRLMVPYMKTFDKLLAERPRLDRAVEELRSIGDKTALSAAQDDSLDSVGFVVARCIEAARAMSDGPGLSAAVEWARGLDRFRAGTNEVRHSTHGPGVGRKWLGDYTAYCDAMLEAFAATQEPDFLRHGEAVLRRALELYSRTEPGDIVAVSGLQRIEGGPDLEMPSLVDDGRPPALPWLMTLCFRYGAVLGDKGLRKTAEDVAVRCSAVANSSPVSFPSLFAAANEVLNVGCSVVRGAQPVDRPGVREFPAADGNKELVGDGKARYVRADLASGQAQ